jgi:DNA-binding CsgD family transcriptional regulator
MAFPAHTLSPTELAQIVAAERQGEPFLLYRHEAGQLRVHPLGVSARVTIGRAEENDVSLGWDAEVSRAHAQLELLGGSWTLVDAGLSRNGSFVNGQRIAGQRRLDDGDTIRLGRCALVFRAPVRAAATTLAANEPALPRLTDAERRVLIALCRRLFEQTGHAAGPASNREIAEQLHLSIPGVKTQIRALFAKLGVEDLPQYGKRSELARRAIELGLVTAADAQLAAANEARPTS